MCFPTISKTPPNCRDKVVPPKFTVMQVEIVRLHDKQVNRHGTPCRIGFTADYIDEAGVFHPGEIVYTENEALFDQFVVGLKVEL